MGHHIPLVRGGRGQCQGRARAREVPCRPHAPRLEKPERGDTREAGAGARAPPGLPQLKEKAPGGMKRQADKENPGGIISLRGLLSSSRKLPRSTKRYQPRLFLLQLDLQRVNAAPERRDLLSAALAALLRALIAPNLFAAGLWNTNLRRRLTCSTLLRGNSLAERIELDSRFRPECCAAFDVLHIILQNSAQVSDVLPRWPMIGSTRLRLLALHSSSVSHACTPKLERRTRCRYSPRSRQATGPCCQSKRGHVGQDIRKRM